LEAGYTLDLSYVAIVFGRNEVNTVKNVLDSLLSQTYKPAKINFVDDGSTDGMYEIAKEYEARYPALIKVFRFDPHPPDFSRLPMLWNTGMDRNYFAHLILPTDAALVPDYAERILKEFEKNNNLIIASGDYGFKQSLSPHGGGRFIRQEFFNLYYPEGYPRILGYESEILERAILEGYKTKCFNDIEIIHHASLGHSHNFKEFGYGMKSLGWYPPYVLFRFINDFQHNKQMGKKGAIKMLYYYLAFSPEKEGYYSKFPKDICTAINARQKRMVKIKALRTCWFVVVLGARLLRKPLKIMGVDTKKYWNKINTKLRERFFEVEQ
jgi:glycosyltransferase involved in cell wall biosynthesis